MSIQNKICSKCKKRKILSEFYKHKGHKFGVSSACKKCIRQRNKEDYYTSPRIKIANKKYCNSPRGKKTRQYYRQTDGYKFNRWKYWLRDKYGLTPEQYNQMALDQHGLCIICKQPETASNQYGLMRLAVDHNHETGKICGLLCQRCNSAIGLLREDAEILKRAIKYLGDKNAR